MNKKIIVIGAIAAAIVIAGGVITVVVIGGTKNAATTTSSHESKSYTAIKACDLLTLAEAKELLGDAAEAGDNTGPQSSEDVNVDVCTYSNTSGAPATYRATSVLVRSPLSHDGEHENEEAFESQKGADAVDVGGYGSAAYFNPQLGQLNVLKDGAWYIINNGPSLRLTESTVADAKLAADKILN